MQRINIQNILSKKKAGEKIVMLTAYDYPLAAILDESGIDMILVGDSLANVVLGLEFTKQVGMTEMLHHAKAANRAVKRAMLVGDMPYNSYKTPTLAVKNAKRFVKEAGCNAVKIEWFPGCEKIARAIVKARIPVIGHVGLTPQRAQELGGLKVQGKDAQAAAEIIQQAKLLEQAGCFSLVLECIPSEIAAMITQNSKIPTIGIGAGADCDGQVLVTYDLLGLFTRFHPKFVKQYTDLNAEIKKAVGQFFSEVKTGKFPDAEHSFSMHPDELGKIKGL
ncbi:MAG: 3-methyl-2-oxobutanoate hydroxymethyltransferase [Omnitrophica WOR_2 bacterium RIFCSPHIGHO2_01_FULL_48_9]|nr:MAG: 3-methyl-2-oxobutanoate hydroxymethyltransferase [Omnitrophica WOR_2 bacterium RIFCSPHIGHO2_02_FULL_48_11]OGX32871.1 MAG: 3-methyl-2-oxobutanoate hydroxymethyltransferase [Omnitrophica WOR_2 bacterium RIFCSPHIGHO2_01_FULL_48_9]